MIKEFRLTHWLTLVVVSGLMGTALMAGCGGKEEPPPVASPNEVGPAVPSFSVWVFEKGIGKRASK